jgi:hypothetical protein
MELKPRTRKEFLIADFIDKDTPDIVPKTRSEMFLKQMLDKISTGGSGSGGGGAFVVTFETADMQTWTADKTFEEISQAHNNGSVCVANMPALGYVAYLSGVVEGQAAAFTLTAYTAEIKKVTFITARVTTDGTVSVDMGQLSIT